MSLMTLLRYAYPSLKTIRAMKKILIIEDDYFSAKRLKRLVMDIDDTASVHGPLKSVDEVVDELSANNDYDLIFSDIRLVDGDVFEAFRKVKPKSFVIFTTAYDEYAMQAIKNNGLDYLMKPIDSKELCAAVDKLKMLSPAKGEVHGNLDGLLNDTRQYRERFLVNKGDELVMLYTDDISYITRTDHQVLAFTEDGTFYSLAMSMADLEMVLDPDKFFRINRQYIANIKGIRRISLFFGSKLIIKLKGCDDENIVISKEKTAQFKKWLDR